MPLPRSDATSDDRVQQRGDLDSGREAVEYPEVFSAEHFCDADAVSAQDKAEFVNDLLALIANDFDVRYFTYSINRVLPDVFEVRSYGHQGANEHRWFDREHRTGTLSLLTDPPGFHRAAGWDDVVALVRDHPQVTAAARDANAQAEAEQQAADVRRLVELAYAHPELTLQLAAAISAAEGVTGHDHSQPPGDAVS